MATDQAKEFVGDCVYQCGCGNDWRDDYESSIPSVFMHALTPGQSGAVEGGLQHVVQGPVDVDLNIIIPTRLIEAGDVNREQAAYLPIEPIEREGSRSATPVTGTWPCTWQHRSRWPLLA